MAARRYRHYIYRRLNLDDDCQFQQYMVNLAVFSRFGRRISVATPATFIHLAHFGLLNPAAPNVVHKLIEVRSI